MLSLILLVLSLILFVLSAYGVGAKVNLTAAGLALMVLSQIVATYGARLP